VTLRIAQALALTSKRRNATKAGTFKHTNTRRRSMNAMLARFVREESGQDLIEYGLLVGIITSTAVLTIRSLGSIVQGFYTNLQTNLK
jgi:Flp pilus assembly pilin Flp